MTRAPGKMERIESFDPDDDAFVLNFEKAQILHKHINILQFVRKNLLPLLSNKGKKLKNELGQLEECQSNLPEGWSVQKHDKNLLQAASKKGIKYLGSLNGNKEYEFEDIENLTQEMAQARLETICDFFRDLTQQAKAKKMSKFMYDPMVQI